MMFHWFFSVHTDAVIKEETGDGTEFVGGKKWRLLVLLYVNDLKKT